MGYYVNSRAFYQRRQTEVTWAALRRAYYEGYPYRDNKLTQYSASIWENLMKPTEEQKDWPQYYDNIVRIIIDNTVNDILPSESVLRIAGTDKLEGDALKSFYDALFNFGPGYKRTPEGFIAWAKKTLKDSCQPGDGLIFLRLIPKNGKRDAYVQWDYYPMEGWCAEQDATASEPLFFRIEYKYDKVDEENGRRTYWHRVDIWPDHIIRYRDTPALVDNFDESVTESSRQPTADSFASILPPTMDVLEPDPQTDAAERMVLGSLSGWIVIPLIWDRRAPDDIRGVSPLRINRLQAIDQVNRLETEWSDAAVQHGNPPLTAVDLDMPPEEGGEDTENTRDDFARADIMSAVSSGQTTQRGTLLYPENLPRELMHEKPLDSLRRATFEGAVSFGLNPENIGRFGNMSSFGFGLLNRTQDSLVKDLRDDLLVSGLLVALQRAMEILDAIGKLPAGIDPNKQPAIKISGREKSADEEQKMATVFASMQDRNVPPEDLAAYANRFLNINDMDTFIDALTEYAERQQELVELAREAHEANISAADEQPGGKKSDSEAGQDNKLK